MSKNNNTTCLIETAIFAALAMALSMIPDFASWFTPSFGAIPLILLHYVVVQNTVYLLA